MAASDYTINFLNGSSTAPVTLPVGTYSYVSNTIPGYAGGNIAQFTVTPTTTSLVLSITAEGILNVTVEDDLGNPITAGALQLSNQAGDTKYGQEVSIASGAASFANVPYTAAGIDFYMAQNSSDSNHNPIEDPQSVSMKTQTQQEAVLNARKTASLNFTIADANYSGITPISGGLVVNG